MNIEGLDTLDNKILEVIKDNARLSYSDIGARVGLSRVAVKNRMEAMEKKGIIQGYITVFNSTCIPVGVHFTVDVEAIPEMYQDVANVLGNDKYIRQLYTTTGDCRFHAIGYAPNHSTLESHLNYLYVKTKGIRRLTWHLLLSTYKDLDGGVEYYDRMGKESI